MSRFLRRKTPLIAGFLFLIVVGGFIAIRAVERNSWLFFDTGKAIVNHLGSMAVQLQAGQVEELESFFSPHYRGRILGLTQPREVREKDGLTEYRFASGNEADRSAALQEWRAYLSSFESIEEVGLHLHRLHSWGHGQSAEATVRYELIGTLSGASRAGIDRGLFRMRFGSQDEPLLIESAELVEGHRLVSDRPHFVDVAERSGVGFKNLFYPEFLRADLRFGMIRYGPGGMTAADYDSDGYYDLFVPDGVESRLLRNNRDGTFEDRTASSGLSGLDGGAVGLFADYDNDGDKDLFVSRTFRQNQLFRNRGDGTFEDVTSTTGLGSECCVTVASWADYNKDGLLDLYLGRYLDPRDAIPTTFYARNGEPNILYRNNGDGTFTNVTEEAGVGELGLCLGTVFGDYNDDGFPDLYVVNDFGRNTLYRNNGNGTFSDVTVESNTLAYGAGMNASFADYDGDGRLDIYVTNIRSEHAWFAEPPTIYRYMLNSFKQGVWMTDMPLYLEILRQSGFDFVDVFQQMAAGNNLLRNRGDGTFEDVTWDANAAPPGWFWSASFADFDNDGWQEIYAANGWVYNEPGTEIELDFLNNVVTHQKTFKTGVYFSPEHFQKLSWHGWERNRMLYNRGDGTFIETGTPTGAGILTNSRGVAVADFWNRGVLDIAIAACDDFHVLLRNEVGLDRSWLEVELVGTKSNRDAVGARVDAWVGGRRQTREVILGDGYASQNTLRLHFGLGTSTSVDRLQVRWPASGQVQTFTGIRSNQFIQITEGSDSFRIMEFAQGDEIEIAP